MALALLTLIAIGIPAIADLHHSSTLAIVAMSVATAVGALFVALLGGAVPPPNTNPSGVWFSFDPAQGPGSWFPAQPGQAPFVAQPDRMVRIIALVAMGASVVLAIVAGVLYSRTFRQIYIVSSEGPATNLTVKLDGGPAQTIWANGADDAPNLRLEVRTDTSHEVVVQTSDHQFFSKYTLDPSTAQHGWVLTPRAREHGLCLAKITWYYGTKPKDDGDALLNENTDLVPLEQSFSHVFEQPPATVQTQNGSSEKRTSLRALDCAALDRGQTFPFKDATHIK